MTIRRKIRYTKGNLCVIWQPHKCVHSFNCAGGLPNVFDINRRPWIILENADNESIINQIKECPTEALSYIILDEGMEKKETKTELTVLKNGPLLFKGKLSIILPDGEVKLEENPALCRCGQSQHKPFCDGTHSTIDFKG